MQRMLLGASIALASLSLLPRPAAAQPSAAFTNGTIEWGLRPDVPRVLRDGQNYQEWYAYEIGAPLMLGANPRQLWYQYYMDRIDRAQRFGYELPPGFDPGPAPANPPPRRFSVWRRTRNAIEE